MHDRLAATLYVTLHTRFLGKSQNDDSMTVVRFLFFSPETLFNGILNKGMRLKSVPVGIELGGQHLWGCPLSPPGVIFQNLP